MTLIKKIGSFILVFVFLILGPLLTTAFAQVDADTFHQALKLKKELYYKSAAVTGGDRNSSDFRVTNIRIAPHPDGYDRVVIDLAGNNAGEKAPLSRPPYYQAEIDSAAKVVHVTLYGKPKLEFPTQAPGNAAKKTKSIVRVELLPLVDNDRWTFTLHLQPATKVEVFELTDPARVIVDLKR